MAQHIPDNREIVVGINDTLTVAGERTVQVGRNARTTVQDNLTVTVRKDMDVSGKNVLVRSAESLHLVCGAASILMKKDGSIVIKGKDITIEGSGKITAKAAGDVSIKGNKVAQN